MRLEVAARESSFFWRRTDDEHSTCAFGRRECSAEVLFGGHYELGGCTEESSALHASMVPTRHLAIRQLSICGGRCRAVEVSLLPAFALSAEKGVAQGTALVGLAETNPTPLFRPVLGEALCSIGALRLLPKAWFSKWQ